jgi:starvation-inducible DNA-binding protein
MASSAKVKALTSNTTATGLDKSARKEVAKCLTHLLAETYLLQLKTQYYHWNVTGPSFSSLHVLFEQEYNNLSAAVDEVAERIRALNSTSPGTFREFHELSSIKEDKTLPADWQSMVKNLVAVHETIIRNVRGWVATAQNADDEGTADLFIRRLQEHEKALWMLRSHLQ